MKYWLAILGCSAALLAGCGFSLSDSSPSDAPAGDVSDAPAPGSGSLN